MVREVVAMKCHPEKTMLWDRQKDKLYVVHSLSGAVLGFPYHFVILCSYCTAAVFQKVYNLKIKVKYVPFLRLEEKILYILKIVGWSYR